MKHSVFARLSALFLSPFLIHSAAAAQVTWVVPSGSSPTIQAGIDAASDGDVVQVLPGTYRERAIDFRGKRIHVMSTGGPEVTFIDAENANRVLLFVTGETSASVLDGFEVRGGRAPGAGSDGGCGLIRSAPTIRNCIFLWNFASTAGTGGAGGDGGAFYISSGASPRFESCLFRDNVAGTGGIGQGGSNGADSGFVGFPGKDGSDGGNGGRGGHGGAAYLSGASATFVSCVFFRNSGGQGGTGGTGGRGGDGYKLFGAWTSRGGEGGDGGRGGASGSGSTFYVDGSSTISILNCSFGRNFCYAGGARGSGGYGGVGSTNGSGGLIGSRGSEGEIAVYGAGGAQILVENSILWDNNDERSDIQVNLGSVSYSNVENYSGGIGNVALDPMWNDAPGSASRTALQLEDDSPCIDVATSVPQTPLGSNDVLGNARVFDHPLLGSTGVGSLVVDMGAYEFLDAFVLPFGCGANPAGTLQIVDGHPAPGQTMTFELSNPYAGQAGSPGVGALPLLLFSFSRQSGCGLPLANFGMQPANSGGFYLGLNDLDGIVGPSWTSGAAASLDAMLPAVSSLTGVSLFTQGVLVGGGGIGLTDPLELVVGP